MICIFVLFFVYLYFYLYNFILNIINYVVLIKFRKRNLYVEVNMNFELGIIGINKVNSNSGFGGFY